MLRHLAIQRQDLHAVERSICAEDVIHWCNHWLWTFDPRERKTYPFDLFPIQERFLHWLAERERTRTGGIVEKSRGMGASYLCMAYALHSWLFRPGFMAGFGSYKEEKVDNLGDPNSLFEKARLMLGDLPPWMRPKGFRRDKHATFRKIINPENGNTIIGEVGDEIGRGGRTTLYVVDEAAHLAHPELADSSLVATTNVRIDVSTPRGPGNSFARRRFSGVFPVFTMHWRDNPTCDDAWYAKIKATTDAVIVAEQYDIDYTASIEGICIPAAWVRAAVNFDLPAAGPILAGLDVAESGTNANVFQPRQGSRAFLPTSWKGVNTTETAWRARDEGQRLGVQEVRYDSIGVGAGVRGTWDTAEEPLPFTALAVNVGSAPTENVWPDGQTSKQKFINLRAEAWWLLRRRFEKTYEHREGKAVHPAEEMISIPDHQQLIADLSLPLVQHTDTGKIKIEAKDAMRRRGVLSPDFGDALALAFLELPRQRELMFW